MKKILPILVLIVAAGACALLYYIQPEPDIVSPERPVTSIEIITVQPESIQLEVRSQGTVLPQTEIDLYSEVSGQIIEVSKNFRSGAAFKQGDALLKIDPIDYQAALATREAEVANAQLNLAREEALSEQAATDWQALGQGEASPLSLRLPQLAQAKAALKSAQALLEQAQQNLAKTSIRAPFDGRILSKNVDLGQYLSAAPTSPIARIYATHAAEVRLPITDREADFLRIDSDHPTSIALSIPNQDSLQTWSAQLDRLEATIDPSSRLLYAVAILENAFTGENPIRRGRFVEARIQGGITENAYSLPRYALRDSDTLYVLTSDNTLVTRTVKVLKSDQDQVVITDGLQAGDQIAISPIAYFVENMPVTVIP
jgi:RND family efflux transporter MFP subunit